MNKEKGMTVYQDRYGIETKLSFDLVKKYLVVGRADLVTPGEMMHFISECKARQLNPYRRDCYIIKFSPNETAAVITAKDYFISRADAQRDMQYWQAGIIVKRDCKPCSGTGVIEKEPCIKCDAEGTVELYREGALPRDGDTLLGGWFRGKKQTREMPNIVEVDLNGYIKKRKDGTITQFWAVEKQPMMIRKVALSQGLREMYPDEFKGLYDAAEVDMEAPLPEEAIDVEGVDVTPTRDIASEINLGEATTPDEVPEIFGEPEPAVVETEKDEPPWEEPTAAEIEQAAKEAAAETVDEEKEAEKKKLEEEDTYRRALCKTFDARMDNEELDPEEVNNALFALVKKAALTSIVEAKVILLEKEALDSFVEDVRAKMEPPEPPPGEVKEWLDPIAMLSRIEKAKTGGMQKLVNDWAYMFDDTAFHAKHGQVVVEFASKYNRLVGENIYGPGQPWEHPPGERQGQGEKPATPMSDSYKVAIEDMMTKMTAKMGAEQADDAFMKALGILGYETYQEITNHEHRKEFFRSLGETLK